MQRGKRGSRSLNDLTELAEQDTSFFHAAPIRSSWSFTNLLPISDQEEDTNKEREATIGNTTIQTAKANTVSASDPRRKSRLTKPRTLLGKFQIKLADQVFAVLEEAAKTKSEKSLEDLFYNISSTVPTKAAEKLNLDMERRWYYYELLATHFYVTEENHPGEFVETILPLCAQLWSLEYFPAIFSLLFHRWLVETEAGVTTKGWVMRFNVFLKGTYQLFWFDLQHDTHKLWPLYIRLRDHMFSGSSPFSTLASPRGEKGTEGASPWEANEWAKQDLSLLGAETAFSSPVDQGRYSQQQSFGSNSAKESIQKDFACVLCRFYYYYSSRPERVGNFCVNQLQLENGIETFVIQLVAQLRAIRNEAVLRRYLKCAASLPIDSLSISAKNKLYATLNELHLPGAPLHPTPKIIQQAEITMNKLFPQGRWSRYAINLFFKLLRPLYLPRSIFAFFTSLFRRNPDQQGQDFNRRKSM